MKLFVVQIPVIHFPLSWNAIQAKIPHISPTFQFLFLSAAINLRESFSKQRHTSKPSEIASIKADKKNPTDEQIKIEEDN